MSDLDTLKQQVTEMQAEIERLEAKGIEPEIPAGSLCWFWNNDSTAKQLDTYVGAGDRVTPTYKHSASQYVWKNARIANDIPGVMVWEKHDGGPCPVEGDESVLVVYGGGPALGASTIGLAIGRSWGRVTAYAIINKAEWME